MSLHLIESRKIAPASARNRDGMIVSVTVHALLILSTFALANASPVLNAVRESPDVIYVEPPRPQVREPQVAHPSAPAAPSTPASPEHAYVPVLVAPIDIPTSIPNINVHVVIDEPTHFIARSTGATSASAGSGNAPNGTGGGGTFGILSDLQVDKPVAVLSGYRTPRYPEAARAAGIEHTVELEFVVDTLGRIESGSLLFRDSAPESFMNAVREALANARYRPAEVGGRRVRQRVAQAFVFSLGKP